MIELWPHQAQAMTSVMFSLNSHKRQYIQLPTGGGKTIVFLKIAEAFNKVLIIVPSVELLKQVYESCLLFFDKSEISRKGADYNEPFQRVHICIINSIRGEYLDKIYEHDFEFTIIDEAHHSQANSYKRFIDSCRKRMPILGVTATPERKDGKLLEEIFDCCSYKIDIETLISQGFLCDIEGFSVKTKIDLSDIESRNGDFNLHQLYKKLCTKNRNEMIVSLIKNHMSSRKNIIFCINIAHSKEISRLLNENGFSSKHIDGSMNDRERNSIVSAFRNGEISALCNCQLLTEGFDEPSIDGVVIARPTRSRSLFTQMVGRGLRTMKGKENCKIIDIVDNHRNLAGFNSLLEGEENYPEPNSFKSIKDIREHIQKELLKVTEFHIERINLFSKEKVFDEPAVPSMIKYLEENKIVFFEPISFDEASFLRWHNELKKEYIYGNNK